MDDKTNRAELAQFLADKRPWDERSHHEWITARLRTQDPLEQEAFAVPEHKAFAREYIAENPLMAPAMPAAALGYYLAKRLGLKQGSRSPPSMDQVFAGIEGTGQGLRDYFKGTTK